MGWQDAPVVDDGGVAVASKPAWQSAPAVGATKKRDIGVAEAGARGVGSTLAEQGNVLSLAASAPAVLADAVGNLFRSQPSYPASDFMFRNVVDTTKNAVDAYALDPNKESMDAGSKVANVGGRIVGMLPSMVGSGGAANPLTGIVGNLFKGAVVAQPTFAVPATVQRSQELMDAGVDRGTVAKTAASNWLFNTAMGAAPVSMAGNVAKRAATGAGINVGTGAAQRGTEGAILGDENAKQAQPAFGVEENSMDAGIGAVMAALFGPRAAGAARPAAGPAPSPSAPIASIADLLEQRLSHLQQPEQTIGGLAGERETVAQRLSDAFRSRVDGEGVMATPDKSLPVQPEAILRRSDVVPDDASGTLRPADDSVTPRPAEDAGGTAQTSPERLASINRAGGDPNAAGYLEAGADPLEARAAFDQADRQRRAGEASGWRADRTEGSNLPQLGAEDMKIITDHTGIDAAEIGALGPNSQRKLLATAMQAREREATRAEGGALVATDIRAQDGGHEFFNAKPGTDQASPRSEPNVPGDRTTVRSEYEAKTGPESRMNQADQAADIEAMTPQQRQAASMKAKQASAEKAKMMASLDSVRTQRDTLANSPSLKELRRRAEQGMLTAKEQKTLNSMEDQLRRLNDSEFTVESSIYSKEGASELGSKSASGAGDRPFRAGNEPEHVRRAAEDQARTKAAAEERATIDRMEAEWRQREETRKSRQSRQRNDQQPGNRYQGAKLSDEAQFSGSEFRVDQDGFVMSTANSPVWFAHQRDAGWWILKQGNKRGQAGQVFQIANHPSGKGFTVQETMRNKPSGGGKPADTSGRVLQGPDAPKPAEPPPQQPKAESKPAREVKGGSRFLQDLKKAGGIDPAFAAEIGGDTAMKLNNRLPGLMRRGGRTGDGLVEWMRDNGYLSRAEIDEADANKSGGAIELAQEKVREAMNGNDVHQIGTEHARFEQDAQRQYEQQLQDEASQRGIDTTGMSEDEIHNALDSHDLAQAAREEGLPPQSEQDVDLISRAAEYNEGAVERLAQQADGGAITEQQFMDGIRRIVEDGDANKATGEGGDTVQAASSEPGRGESSRDGGQGDEAGLRSQDGGGERAGERGGDQGQGVHDAGTADSFILKGERPDELRARDRQRNAAAERQRRVDKAPPPEEFTMTGSDRPADEAAARGQQELSTDGEKRSGGGTLYGGFPLDKMAEAVGKSLTWATGDAKAWKQSAAAFVDIIQNVKDRVPRVGGNPVVRFARFLFDSASADMRAVLKNAGDSATAKFVVDQFHTEAGSDRVTGETFRSAVDAWTNGKLQELHSAIGKFVDANDKDALAQIVAQVRNPASIRKGTPVGDAAHAVRTMLDDTLKYMRAAGVDIGEVKNGYFPREFDVSQVMRAPEQFKDAVARAYRELGLTAKDADASANTLHDSLVYGDGSGLYKSAGGNTQASFLKQRVFGKQVENDSHPLHKFFVNDPAVALPIYLQRAARRAEIARRFGDGFENWEDMVKKIKAEGGGDSVKHLAEYVGLAAGLRNPNSSNFGVRGTSIMRTWGSLMFLEKATLSSLTEFIVPAIRSGNVLDTGRMLKNTVADLFTNTKSAGERKALAEDLGILASGMSDLFNAARFSGGEPVSLAESRILDKYFKRTGLTQWTEATRVAAVDMARVFLRRVASDYSDGGGKLANRHLAELGVPETKRAEFSRWLLAQNDGLPTAAHLASGGEMAEQFRRSARRFVSQGIMNPDATLKPSYMTTPIGSLLGQLQSFNYAFWENVLKRNARLAKEAVTSEGYTASERAQLLMPTMMLPLLFGAAYAIGEARDELLGNQERRKEETGTDKAIKAISRGIPIAPLDPWLNYATSAKYQRSAVDFIAGPVLGTAGRGLDAARNLVFNNKDNTNTAERNAAKALYDLAVEPAINLALTSTPVAPLSAAITQAAGAGSVREKLFVTPIAGEKKATGSGGTGRATGRETIRNTGRESARN